MGLKDVKAALDDIRAGKMIILVDDEDRENEGDLCMAAEKVTPEAINFMATHGRGLICLTLTEEKIAALELEMMTDRNTSAFGTGFTVSIEASEGVTTGISTADRAHTIKVACDPKSGPDDIATPGHVFPIRAREGGVLVRTGQTEGSVDLARLAGLEPAGVICEIMNEDGTMAKRPELEIFAKKHDLKIGTIADLIHYRAVKEKTVECINERDITTAFGDFRLLTYRDIPRQQLHYALVKGQISPEQATLVRVHVLDAARDVLAMEKPGDQEYKSWTFHNALRFVEKEGSGVVVLICQSDLSDTVEESVDWMLSGKQARPSQDMVYRQIGTGAQILQDLGVQQMRLMSAPLRFTAISGFDLQVVEQLSCPE